MTLTTLFKKTKHLAMVCAAGFMLVACGGGGSNTADTTPPSVSAFSVKNGAAINAASDASYAVSGNVGTTQEYTLTFSEKLDASSYSVKMLDSNNAQVALPTGMTATLTANDAGNQTYTLTITANGSFVFDAGQPSKAVKLQISVADVALNTVNVNVTETVNHVDTAGVATITGPTQSTGAITFNLSASDVDGIASWSVTSQRTRNTGVVDPIVVEQTASGTPPSSVTSNIGGSVGNTYLYTLKIVDEFGGESTGTWTVTRN